MSLSNIEIVSGWVRLIQTAAWFDQKLWLGGYAIHYDRDGKEKSRSSNSWYCSLEGPAWIPPGYEDLTLSIALGTTPPPYAISSKQHRDENNLVPRGHLVQRCKAFLHSLSTAFAEKRYNSRYRN